VTNLSKWQDVRDEIVARLGGEEAISEARRRNQAYIDGHWAAEDCVSSASALCREPVRDEHPNLRHDPH